MRSSAEFEKNSVRPKGARRFPPGCAGELTLAAMNAVGQELGTTVVGSYKVEDVAASAADMLA